MRAASAASGAVSARSTRLPSVTGVKPCASAKFSSARLKPPSGPERNSTGPLPGAAACSGCVPGRSDSSRRVVVAVVAPSSAAPVDCAAS